MADQTTKQEEGLSYSPSSLPPPTDHTHTYLRAVIVELRVLNRAIKALTELLSKPEPEEPQPKQTKRGR